MYTNSGMYVAIAGPMSGQLLFLISSLYCPQVMSGFHIQSLYGVCGYFTNSLSL